MSRETGLDTKRLAINMFYGIIAFALNLFISFFITPYITENFGADAYGFIKLATDFASYASLFTIALNSMASRFIMLRREVGDVVEAQKYYSSITVANIILSVVLTIVSAGVVVYLEYLIEIPNALVSEVKVVFALTFVNLIINLIFSTWGNCYYLTNRLDINSIKTAQSNIIRIIFIIAAFNILTPRLSYVIWGTIIASVYLIACNLKYTKVLTPELRFDVHSFEIKKVWEVLASGIWNSITKLSQIFSSGLDLLVTNKFIGAIDMGYLSVAKTIPNLIVAFNATVANVFSPNLMQLYAKGNKGNLVSATQVAMRVMSLFVAIPNAILITMGVELFRLWVPGEPAELLNILSILTIINSSITGPMQPLYQIFTITNKIKQSSIVMIVYGFVTVLITFICLNITDWGLFAVTGVSLVGSIIVALFYHVPYSAKYLGVKWYTFYPEIGKSLISLGTSCVIGFMVNGICNFENSWLTWFGKAIIVGILCLLVNMYVILKKEERQMLIEKVLSKVNKLRR